MVGIRVVKTVLEYPFISLSLSIYIYMTYGLGTIPHTQKSAHRNLSTIAEKGKNNPKYLQMLGQENILLNSLLRVTHGYTK